MSEQQADYGANIPANPTANNPLRMIHDLKGAPLSILCVMLILRQSGQSVIQAIDLATWTNYTQDTICQALKKLETPFLFGLVTRVKGGWALSEHCQLPLSFVPKSEILGFFSTTTNINILNNKKDGRSSKATKIRNFRILENATPEERERWEALKRVGIFYNNMTAELVKMEHVTPEYIAAKAAEYKSTGRGGQQNIGLLINAIGSNEPVLEIAEQHESVSALELLPAHDSEDDDDMTREERFPGFVNRRQAAIVELGDPDLTERERNKLMFIIENCNAVLGYELDNTK